MDTTSIMIGAGIGGAIGLAFALQMFRWQKQLVAAVDKGDLAKARALIAKHAPAVKAKGSFPNLKLLPQRTRVLGLWLVGDLDAVRAELALHTGGPAYLTNVHLFGLLALATEPGTDAQSLIAEAEQVCARVDKEAAAIQKLLKDYAKMLVAVGIGLAGRPIDGRAIGALLNKVGSEPVLTKILALRMIVVAAERAGTPSPDFAARLRVLTTKWSVSR
jgi:hypothetical protein